MRSFCDLRGDRFENRWMIVAENQRAMSAEVVDVFVSIHVPFARACSTLYIDGMRLQITTDVSYSVGQQRSRTVDAWPARPAVLSAYARRIFGSR